MPHLISGLGTLMSDITPVTPLSVEPVILCLSYLAEPHYGTDEKRPWPACG